MGQDPIQMLITIFAVSMKPLSAQVTSSSGLLPASEVLFVQKGQLGGRLKNFQPSGYHDFATPAVFARLHQPFAQKLGEAPCLSHHFPRLSSKKIPHVWQPLAPGWELEARQITRPPRESGMGLTGIQQAITSEPWIDCHVGEPACQVIAIRPSILWDHFHGHLLDIA